MIVLMYHGITSPLIQSPPDREMGAEFYDVSLDNFRAQMLWLKNSKLKAMITFDDGEMNNYKLAFPIIKALGLHAYFFIIVKRIGRTGYMGWDELKTLKAEGMTVGSHGLSHEILTNLKESQIDEELRGSKKCLEFNLAASIDTFSVPRGFCNKKIIEMAHEAGYTQVFISEKPEGLNAHGIPRIAVKAGWNLKRFQQALKNHVPASAVIGDAFKNTAKILLREPGYDLFRKALIYLIK